MGVDTPVILIIDDNPTNLNVLFEYLEESGFEVSVAQNGRSALEQVAQIRPDLILLDIMMPDIDGFEICRTLKKRPETHGIPIIFMTALTDASDKIKGFLAGGSDYITKPLQYEEVLARITAHLKLRTAEQRTLALQQSIEEQKRLLAEKERQLIESNACKDTFFTYISTDLQPPLNSLLGFVRVLLENLGHYSKEQINSDLLRVQAAAERLQSQHENLIMWSKVQRGGLDFSAGLINVEELVVYNLIFFAPIAKQKQITLQSTVQTVMLAHADYEMVNAIIRNLMSNALKFTDTGGKVSISAIEHDDFVELFVSDSGIGMSAEQVHLLLHHQTVCPDGDDEKKRIGLGLLLCKSLIERCGGTLRIETQLGKGTSFIFTLPKHPPYYHEHDA